MSVNLGAKVQDSLTGFSGTVVARAEYLFGCVRCEVVGNDPDKNVWIDEQRLELVGTAKSGGSQYSPTSIDPK